MLVIAGFGTLGKAIAAYTAASMFRLPKSSGNMMFGLTSAHAAGAIAMLMIGMRVELEPGKLTPCYVSIDKWTNTLEPMPVSLLEKRARIKEADLSEGKQMDFYGGGKVLLEG